MQSVQDIVVVALLSLHLVSIQVAAAGPAVAMWLEWHSHQGHRTELFTAGRRLAGQSILGLILGVATGWALFFLATRFGNRDYASVWLRFQPRIGWGVWELLFSLMLMLFYFAGWNWACQSSRRRSFHRLVAALSVTNLLYHFPALLTVIVNELPHDSATVPLTSAAYRQLIFAPAVIAKSLHFGFASFTTTSAWVFWQCPSNSQMPAEQHAIVRHVSAIATIALVGLLVTGFWLLAVIPPERQFALTGGNLWSTGLLAAGVVVGLVSLNRVANSAFGGIESNRPRRTALLIVVATVLMIVMTARQSRIVASRVESLRYASQSLALPADRRTVRV